MPSSPCIGAPTSADAAEALLRIAAGALGDATSGDLRTIGAEAGREIGVAVEPNEVMADPAYDAALDAEATSLTAENAMKWGPIHPAPDTWVFGPADAVVALAEARRQRVRGHTLVWGALQLPAYVESASDAASLRTLMAEHVSTVVGRWAGRIAQWDVVNEPLAGVLDPPTADGLDDNVFRRLLGPGYVAEALHLARAADPAAKLFVNENGIEVPGPRQDRFFTLVQELLAAGAPLDGVGFQAHLGLIPLGTYPDRDTIAASLRRFADLGLTVELTELDVTLVFRPGDLPSRLAFQGGYYRDVTAACGSVPACSGVTTWGLSDAHTWLRSFFGFTDWPLPFDDDWRRKRAYFGMRAALFEAALRDGA
ncbi:MAG: endo-1,4-beta-xylanase [Burkholderiaceae bacterium]